MLRSLYSGVTGLKSHQTKLDAIGNNVSNVNTIGYRGKTVNFSDVLYQTAAEAHPANQATASTNPYQIGLGSKVSSVTSTMGKEGSTQVTGNTFDMRISGQPNAFFVVKSGNETFYTRDGAFGIDAERNLVLRSNGAYVQGWKGEQAGGAVTKLTMPDPKTESHLVYDTGIDLSGDISEVTYGEAGTQTFTGTIKERSGSDYRIEFDVEKVTDDPDDATYTLKATKVYIKNAKGEEQEVKLYGDDNEFTLKYDRGTGKLVSIDGGGGTHVSFTIPGRSSLSVDLEKTYYQTPPAGGTAGSLSAATISFDDVGKVSGYEVSGNGAIYTVFSNGNREIVGRVATAAFSNPEGLLSSGDNLYKESVSSGDPRLEDIAKMGGSITSGALEMSNVDLASEMTELIVDQRGFQANSKVITTSDEMLQTLRDLKR
ncbi:MAG: flagellar hook-basal body complex protein [Lachnospiraceae bacterium]|nr:flagellar hook-basal body complex protein [Lachnospiraceae bacterium]